MFYVLDFSDHRFYSCNYADDVHAKVTELTQQPNFDITNIEIIARLDETVYDYSGFQRDFPRPISM